MIDKMKSFKSVDFMAMLTAMQDPAKTMQPLLIKKTHLPFCPLGEDNFYLFLKISMFVLNDIAVTNGGQICSVCGFEKSCKKKYS